MEFQKAILAKYKLSAAEKKLLMAKIGKVIKRINAEINKQKAKADVVIGGSASKGTLLKGDFDVDLFVRFDRACKNISFSDCLGKILKPFKPARLQGSRDYFQFSEAGINYELVPVLRIKTWQEAANVTDASPLHVTWVTKNTRKNPKLVDDIILAKVFLKANRLYGAESYIGGFSGHVVDILIINYGSFLGFIKAASKWTPFTVIDVEKHYRGKRPDLNQSKVGPLILIDPVQPQRNAAAAVSLDTFNRTIAVAKAYLKAPGPTSFEKEHLTEALLREKAGANRLIILNLALKKAKLDVNGARIVKALEFISAQLAEKGFRLIAKGWDWDKTQKALIWLILDKAPLAKTKIHAGPPVNMPDHAAAFKKAYKKTYVQDGKLFAEISRRYTLPEELVKAILADDYLTEKLSSVKLAK
jgi:tRNA nucleotidyltransferase (CCA-adding enzyme)